MALHLLSQRPTKTFLASLVIFITCCVLTTEQPLLSEELPTNSSIVRRVAFDLGSGKVKVQVADVDVTTNTIFRVVFTKSVPLEMSQDLVSGGQGRFSEKIQTKALETIAKLKRLTDVFAPESYRGVATAAFRKASNGGDLIQQIDSQLGIPVTIIDQDEEGALGFLTMIAESGADPEEVICWDTGGGSFQITAQCGQEVSVLQGDLGINSFKNWIIRELDHQDPNDTASPNPIWIHEIGESLEYVASKMGEIPSCVRKRLNDYYVRIAFLSHSAVLPDQAVVTSNDLWNLLEERLGLSDEELAINLSLRRSNTDIAVAYPLLLLGIMKSLGIHELHVYEIVSGNTSGLLISEKYWD